MSITPVDMKAMVHRTFELDKSAQDRSAEMNNLNVGEGNKKEKEVRRKTDKVVKKSKNEKKLNNRLKEKRDDSKNRKEKKESDKKKKISLDISV